MLILVGISLIIESQTNYNIKIQRKRRQNIQEKLIENGSFYIFSASKFQNKKKIIWKNN